jgi:signal transduction histidine kinase
MQWWRRLGLRGRLMLVGTGGVVLGLAIGSVAIVAAMSYALQRTVDVAANDTATSIASMIEEDGEVPRPIPVPAGQIAQVLDRERRVWAGSADADLIVKLLRDDELDAALNGARLDIPGDRALRSQPLRVMARQIGSAGNQYTIIVAVPVGDFNRSVALLRTALFVSQPLVVLVLVLVGWRVVGASLRSVEVLRSGAERITGSATEERLPVPPSHDEIHRLAVTLNDMIDRLARARARQRAFVADAAHELRSPLASIRVQLEVAQRLGDWTSVGDDILIDVDRLTRLVDDLLLLARADEGRRAVARELVEVGDLLGDVAGRYGAARVPVTVEPVDDELWTEGEPDALHRILVNLVDNAVRHARTAVRLSAAAEGEHLLITVVDDGTGIPEPDRRRVFDRFTRLDDGRARDAGGTGLGLAIVRELVRRHSGSVLLTDAAPGVRAEVRLPSAPTSQPRRALR